MRCFLFLSLLACGLADVHAAPSPYPKAWLIRDPANYADILSYQKNNEPVYIHKDDAADLHYGMSENDLEPQTHPAWDVYDVLYEDVAPSYLLGLQLLASGDAAQAEKMFIKSSKEKSLSKLPFKETPTFKTHLDEKLLLCALALGKSGNAEKYFKLILQGNGYHAKVRTTQRYIKYLIEQQSNPAQAQQLAEDLLKKNLKIEDKAEIEIQRCLAMSLQKKHGEAKFELEKVVLNYADKVPDIEAQKNDALSTIIIYHEKSYSNGVNFFTRLLKDNRKYATASTYLKLGDCYTELKRFEEARWNYINAFNLEYKNKALLESIIDKVLAMNREIAAKESGAPIEQFMNKVKATL